MNYGSSYGGGNYGGVTPGTTIAVNLQRMDGSIPWGFRLQGGTDFRMPLSVKKVSRGSPSENKIHAGDAITAIGGMDTSNMTHMQAQQMIKTSGCALQLTLGKGQFRSIRPSGPVKFSPAMAHGY